FVGNARRWIGLPRSFGVQPTPVDAQLWREIGRPIAASNIRHPHHGFRNPIGLAFEPVIRFTDRELGLQRLVTDREREALGIQGARRSRGLRRADRWLLRLGLTRVLKWCEPGHRFSSHGLPTA